jgi:arylsulfatase A-like enzyme
MDRLTAEEFNFRKALAPSSWTNPSVASLLTGLYPARHGAVCCPTFLTGLSDLKESHRTLAEYLKETGYRTAAMVTNPHIDPWYRFDQGFDEFMQPAGKAGELLDKALEWIRNRQGERRFFLQDPREMNPMDPEQAGVTTRALKRAIETRIQSRTLNFKGKAAETILSEEERRRLKELGYF